MDSKSCSAYLTKCYQLFMSTQTKYYSLQLFLVVHFDGKYNYTIDVSFWRVKVANMRQGTLLLAAVLSVFTGGEAYPGGILY